MSPPPRALRWTVVLALAASACEIVAGLSGKREEQPVVEAGGCVGALGAAGSCGGGSEIGGSIESAGSIDTGGVSGSLTELPKAQQGGEGGAGATSGAGGSGGEGLGCNESDAASVAAKSCASAAQCNGESACTTLCVPGGTYLMGRGNQGTDAYPGAAYEQPEHRVTVSPYWLDKYEVTVGRFRSFVESYDGSKPAPNSGAHPKVPASGWKPEWNDSLPSDRAALEASLIASDENCNSSFRTWTSAPSKSECLPMNCVDWYVSFAFCVWDGGRLPSEAEWEFAAAGGDQNRLFPWGAEPPDSSRAVFGCSASGSPDCSSADIRDVGSRPLGDGRWLHADLAGSMAERMRDVYDPQFYSLSSASGSDIINLVFDTTEASGAVRGGSYASQAGDMRATVRVNTPRSNRWDGVGWRCARNP